MRPAAGGIQVVCFDLGGVVVDLGGVGDLAALGDTDVPEFWRRWLESPWVRDYERGRLATGAFARGIAEAWPFRGGAEAFLEVFARWPRGLFAGAEDLLLSLRSRVGTACLSNTNPLHWERQGHEWGLERLFDVPLLSFQTGFVKPDREAYTHAAQRCGVPPSAILFLDDNEVNVEGARRAGLGAEHVRGIVEARAVLARLGLVG